MLDLFKEVLFHLFIKNAQQVEILTEKWRHENGINTVNILLQGSKYRISVISAAVVSVAGCNHETKHVLLGKRMAIKNLYNQDDEHTCRATIGTGNKKRLVEKFRQVYTVLEIRNKIK